MPSRRRARPSWMRSSGSGPTPRSPPVVRPWGCRPVSRATPRSGHLTIGAGRLVYQPLSRINRAIDDGSFYENPVLRDAVDRARDRGAALHCLGLVSPGGVHSHQEHAVAVAELARRRGFQSVWFHAFLDGRDEPPTSAAGFVRTFLDAFERIGVGAIASVAGRYYGMDRDRRWDRIQRAYDVIVGAAGDAVAPTQSPTSKPSTPQGSPTSSYRRPRSCTTAIASGSRTATRSSSSTSVPTARASCAMRSSTGFRRLLTIDRAA